ncbi:MAG: NAD(P)H-hydrate dehydratase [Acidimicrobiia bacterium]
MLPVVTPAEMAEADRRAVASGTAASVLMDRAGRAVAWAVRRRLEGTYGRRVVIVCGKGNNGGDGLVTAAALRGWGARVDVFELGDLDRNWCARAIGRADAVVDAMFGTGFRGALDGDAAWFADAAAALPANVARVAIDIPSGVDGRTGAIDGPVFHADETVTFAALKTGLCSEPGRSAAGTVHVAAIGIDVSDATIGVVEAADVTGWLPARHANAHKWRSGVMVVGGSAGMTGAPMFVSHAALRTGAGIVWCAVPASGTAAAPPTEVITKTLPATAEGSLDEPAVPVVLKDLDRFQAVVLGPGLGTDPRTAAAVGRLVAQAPVPLVLDADGLNALHGDLAALRVRYTAMRVPTVLTPHEGEYARLLGEPVGADRVGAARRLSAESDAVVLLKGPGTVIAAPDGRVAIAVQGGPWLATAGTGDVLSGMIAGLLARGVMPFEAAAGGAWLHSRAADLAGHTGLLAGDIVAAIPAALESVRAEPSR